MNAVGRRRVLEAEVATLREENRELKERSQAERATHTSTEPIQDCSSDTEFPLLTKSGQQNVKQLSYLDTARRAEENQHVSEEDRSKLHAFTARMGPIMRPDKSPMVELLYFKNLPKTERTYIEEAVRDLLANRRLLHVSFIKNSVMELLVEKVDSPSESRSISENDPHAELQRI